MANEQSELVEVLEWVVFIFVTLALAGALIAGVTVGCQASRERNDRINAHRALYKSQEAFYQLCKRRALAGVLPLPRRCPR